MRLSKAECADQVFDVLYGSAGMTKAAIVKASKLTAAQVTRGLDGVSDFLAEMKEQPLVYEQGEYKFALTERQSLAYLRRRYKGALSQLRKSRTRCLVPSQKKFGHTAELERMDLDMTRLEEDLELMMKHLDRVLKA
jgi:hypothetical protein